MNKRKEEIKKNMVYYTNMNGIIEGKKIVEKELEEAR